MSCHCPHPYAPFMRNQSVQPMQIYLFTGGAQSQELKELSDRLSEALPNLTILTKLSDAPVSAAPGHDPAQNLTYIIVPFLNTASPLDRVISIAEQDHPGTFFIFISKEISASEYKRLTRTGGADWVSLDGAPQEILDILSRRSSLQTSAADARQTNLFIAGFVPSGGGVGNTTLALETAIQLKLAKRNASPAHLFSGPGCSNQPRLRLPGYRTAAEDGRNRQGSREA